MARVHCVAQAKGGVGKSMVAVLLAQYLARTGRAPMCIDADPVHATLASYPGLAVRQLPWRPGAPCHARAFDAMLQWIAQTDQDVIIDSSASAYLPLLHHLAGPSGRGWLARIGHEWVVHSLVAGGPAFLETLDGFAHSAARLPQQARFVLWLNPFWGDLSHQGQGVEDMPPYRAHRSRIAALVRLPTLHPQTDGRALAEMLQQRQTFAEALAIPSRSILARQRLRLLQRRLFAQLDMAMVL